METIDIFKIPIFSGTIPLNTKPLIQKIHKLKKQNPRGDKFSNIGGWQHKLPYDFDKNLIDALYKNINIFAKNIKLKTPIKLCGIWVNINNYGNSNATHIHPKSQLSGVFYLKAPKNSGNIVFENPVGPLLSYDWNSMYVEEFNHYTSFTYSLVSEDLKFFMFPGWLSHYVEPSRNKKEERISISFNYEYI